MKSTIIARLTLASAVAVAIAVSGTNCVAKDTNIQPMKTVKLTKHKNADFYLDGKFQVDKAKQAYFDMMAAYGYPVSDSLRTNMWATDFGLGDFANVGMAGGIDDLPRHHWISLGGARLQNGTLKDAGAGRSRPKQLRGFTM